MHKIPMAVPRIGAKQEAPVDITQAQKRACPCGCDLFDKALRIGFVSKLAAGNRTGQDLNVEAAVYVCRKCGAVLGETQTGGGSNLPNP